MKTLTRVTIFVVLLAILLSSAPVGAQEEEEEIILPVSAVYYQAAASGSLEDNGDGTYTLALEDTSPELIYFASAPVPAVRRVDVWSFMANWAAVEDLTAVAVLETEDLNILMVLGAPVYDAMAHTQTYVATVTEVVALGETEEAPAVPAKAFGSANLSIIPSLDFQLARVAAINPTAEGVRGGQPGCPTGCDLCRCIECQWFYDNRIMALVAEINTLMVQHAQAAVACSQGSAAACVQLNQLTADINAKVAELHNLVNEYHSYWNCP